MKILLFRLSMSLFILCMIMFAIGHPAVVGAAPKPSNTPRPTNTSRPTSTARPTNPPKLTNTPRFTFTQTASAMPSPTETNTLMPTFTATASNTPTDIPTYTPTATVTATYTPTDTPIVLADTTTVVTDNATTIPTGPAPVTFGETIVFTATISSVSGTPNGSVRWTLSHDARDSRFYGITPELDNELDRGSGIVGACQGDVPVINGTATCAVTPGWWYLDGDEPVPFYWGIRATATFTPAVGSPFLGSSGSDGTNKITTGDRIWPYCGNDDDGVCDPFVAVSIEPFTYIPFWIAADENGTDNTIDSLGRKLVFHWCVGVGVDGCPHSTSTPHSSALIGAGLTTFDLIAVCPEGIGFFFPAFPQYWDGSFECNYPEVHVTLKNEYQGSP